MNHHGFSEGSGWVRSDLIEKVHAELQEWRKRKGLEPWDFNRKLMFTYNQKTGELYRGLGLIGIGYSGHEHGLNNPDMETVPDVGPIPAGMWQMEVITGEDGLPTDYEGKKAPVLRLAPISGTNTFGRSGFLIHGDLVNAPGADLASLGCIILPKYAREIVANAIVIDGDNKIEVASGL